MKKNLKKLVCCLLVFTLLSAMTGCTTYNNFKAAFFAGEAVASEPTIKIGVYESLTGQTASQGKAELLGIQLANELYPTVLGMKVELITADNQSNMYAAEPAIQELLSQKPAVVLGSYGETVTLIASDYIKAASTPAITISSTNPLITSNNEFYFSATFNETRQGDALADFAYNGAGKTLVATVKQSKDDAATEIIKRFTNKIKKLTGDSKCVVATCNLAVDATDYTKYLDKIRNSGAQAVFLALQPSLAQNFLQQAADQGLTDVLWLGGRSWSDEKFLEFVKSHPELEIGYSSDFGQEITTDRSAEFLALYQSKFGEDAAPAENTAVAFDAYLLALEAIELAQAAVWETTEEDLMAKYETEASQKAAIEELVLAQETGVPSGRHIRMALSSIKKFEGASGTISFSGKNEATKTITVHHIAGGEELGHHHVD